MPDKLLKNWLNQINFKKSGWQHEFSGWQNIGCQSSSKSQKTLKFRGKTQEEENCRNNKRNAEKEKMQKSSRQKRRERRQARLKRRIRTNSGAISMSEVEASSMAEPESTKNKTLNQLNLWEPWQSSAVFKPVRLNRSSHGSLSFHICRFLRLKEPFWWTVFGYPGRTVWFGLGFKTLIKTTHSYLKISLFFFLIF